jgi:hypothetical protein
VEHGLSCIKAVVDDHPVAALIETFLRSNGLGNKEKVTNEFTIRNGDTVDVGDMFFGHDESVNWCLGIEVFKGECVLVLMDDRRRNFFFDDLAKNTVRIRTHSFSPGLFPEKLLKKQERSPVWQAGPVCSTFMRSVS